MSVQSGAEAAADADDDAGHVAGGCCGCCGECCCQPLPRRRRDDDGELRLLACADPGRDPTTCCCCCCRCCSSRCFTCSMRRLCASSDDDWSSLIGDCPAALPAPTPGPAAAGESATRPGAAGVPRRQEGRTRRPSFTGDAVNYPLAHVSRRLHRRAHEVPGAAVPRRRRERRWPAGAWPLQRRELAAGRLRPASQRHVQLRRRPSGVMRRRLRRLSEIRRQEGENKRGGRKAKRQFGVHGCLSVEVEE